MKEKLWSPGQDRACWILWYSDQEGAGDKRVYIHKLEAEQALREMLQDVVDQQVSDVKYWDDSDDKSENLSQLQDILKQLQKDPWGALSDWESYAEFNEPDATIHAEDGRIFGA